MNLFPPELQAIPTRLLINSKPEKDLCSEGDRFSFFEFMRKKGEIKKKKSMYIHTPAP